MSFRVIASCLAALLLAFAGEPAFAHHPTGGAVPQTLWHGLLSGLGHPLIGVDHLAFIVGIGLIAGIQGVGLAVPMAFVAASLAGVLAGQAGTAIASIEALVAGTVALAGLAMALRFAPGRSAWLVLAAAAGLLHGLVYGETVVGAEATPVAAYLIGLAAVQGAIAVAAHHMGTLWRGNPFLESRARGAGVVLGLIGASYIAIALTAA
jgi:urease accessory protein